MEFRFVSGVAGVGVPPSNITGFFYPERVHHVREEFARRIQNISAKSALKVADRLELAYYQNTLRLFESLPPETMVHAGVRMTLHVWDHPKEVREINEILDYLSPDGGKLKRGSHAESMSFALPVSARPSSKRGRPVTRRPIALRALQMKIDTNMTWRGITNELCRCGKPKHTDSCKEMIRQSVITLRRRLRSWGVALP